MNPQAIQQLMSSPALSLGLALALSVPLGGAGFALWFWGKRGLKVVSFFVSGLLGLILGLLVGALIGGRLETIAAAIVGLIAGATLGLTVFRFMVACMSGLAVFFLTVSVGMSVLGGAQSATTTAQGNAGEAQNPSAPSAMKLLSEMAVSKLGAGLSKEAQEQENEKSQAEMSSLARDALSKTKASKERGPAGSKEYVDVRALKKGPNKLQVEQTKDASGKTKLVIKDEHYAKVDTNPVSSGQNAKPTEIAKSDSKKTDATSDGKQAGADGETDELASGEGASGAQAADLESLLKNGGLAGVLNGQGGAMPDMKGVFAVLGIGTFFAMCAFGLAIWLHRHAVAVLSAGLGAWMMVSSGQLIVEGALGTSGAVHLEGLLFSLVRGVVWVSLLSLGAWLQLRRKVVATQESGIVYGKLPARASGGEAPPLPFLPPMPEPEPEPVSKPAPPVNKPAPAAPVSKPAPAAPVSRVAPAVPVSRVAAKPPVPPRVDPRKPINRRAA